MEKTVSPLKIRKNRNITDLKKCLVEIINIYSTLIQRALKVTMYICVYIYTYIYIIIIYIYIYIYICISTLDTKSAWRGIQTPTSYLRFVQ